MRCLGLTVFAALLLMMMMFTQHADAASTAIVARNCKRMKLERCYGKGAGWFALDRTRCFKVFNFRRTFDQAQAHCEHNCGDLVSMHNVPQYDKVLCRLFKMYRGRIFPVWVGGERQKNGKFGWTDGTAFNFSRWHKGQPDNYRKRERCAEMNWGTWGLWNDLNCKSRRRFVCAVPCKL